jgi:hypothetical protein
MEKIKDINMKTYTGKEINEVLQSLSECDIICDEDTPVEIPADVAELQPELLDPLVGYTVKFEQDGDHKHDGQMVRYEFTFTSPEGAETYFVTNMCLMIGWDHHDTVTIK